jgi:hypothetical protein
VDRLVNPADVLRGARTLDRLVRALTKNKSLEPVKTENGLQ